MKSYLISDNSDTLVGMRMVGIKGELVKDKKSAESLLDSLVKDKEIGIILITEKAASLIPGEINFVKQKMHQPLIIEIPDRHGSIKDDDYITGYVRDSIGIKI